MKILLGATVALLIGALAMSYSGMKQGVADAPKEEQARIKLQIAELNLEVEKLKAEKAQQSATPTTYAPAAPIAPAIPTDSELANIRAQLAEKDAAIQKLEKDKNKAERNAKLSDEEISALAVEKIESHDGEQRRARLIAQALPVAVVKEYAEDPQNGDFAVLETIKPEQVQVQVGDILGIRKKTGILGQLKVTRIDPEGIIATVMPGFGPVKPQVGDELIVPPTP